MEFFARASLATDPETLQRELGIEHLAHWCDSIDAVLEEAGDRGRIYCVWGEFAVTRDVIRGGVRFSLPGCPNALAWTITTGLPPEPEAVVIHCTINRREHDPDFIETIEAFVDDWRRGLETGWTEPAA
ncbi:hypothetical protein [Thioalkalivibrio sp.]|uniref:hypothetical protein n=1 Tax=Thioalkalivibrio sp. TaxID=2093813 RepID=UPI003974B983